MARHYADYVDLVLEFGNVLADRIHVGQLGFDVGDPDEEARDAVIAQLVALLHGLLQGVNQTVMITHGAIVNQLTTQHETQHTHARRHTHTHTHPNHTSIGTGLALRHTPRQTSTTTKKKTTLGTRWLDRYPSTGWMLLMVSVRTSHAGGKGKTVRRRNRPTVVWSSLSPSVKRVTDRERRFFVQESRGIALRWQPSLLRSSTRFPAGLECCRNGH